MRKKITWLAVLFITSALAVAQTNSDKGTSGTQTTTQAITNGPVAEYIADTGAVLGWSVQDASSSMSLKYGTDRDHLDQTAQAVPGGDGRSYHVHLKGLTAGTRYYFRVMQKDEPVGGVGTFSTVASGAPPVKSKALIPE